MKYITPVLLVLTLNTLFAGNLFNYLFPLPGSEALPVQTNIVFSFDEATQLKTDPGQITVIVNGNKSGRVSGTLIKTGDGSRFVFRKSADFFVDESVTVKISIRDITNVFSFTTAEFVEFDQSVFENISDSKNISEMNYSRLADPQLKTKSVNGVSVPYDFPEVDVNILKNTAPGKLFLNNWGGRPYIMILENDGTPYFYQRVEDRARDFKVQATGTLTRRYIGNLYSFVELDSNYQIIDTLSAAPGYGTDEHDVQLHTNGNYLVIGLDYKTVDMSKIIDGGNPNATVIGNSVQELDRNGNLLLNWRSWDYFNIEDAVHENLRGGTIDYVHMNAVAYDYDGNIVFSSRHLDEITKIDRNTGEIIWRFGGLHSDFYLTNDQYGISYQHDVRPVPDHPNRYTVMDNGNFHNPKFSRAFEFEVDTVNMTARKVWEYRHTPDRYTWWMGSVQRLPNGNTLINYADASLPKAVEVTPAGEVVYEMNFEGNINCYRTFRFDWESTIDKPYLIVDPFPDKVSLLFNKFGDNDVDYYNIYAGEMPNPENLLTSSPQPWLDLTTLPDNSHYYFRVTAVNSAGKESEFSNEVAVDVNYTEPNENLISNGDFSAGALDWNLATYDGAQATTSLINGEYNINISNPGTQIWHVQLTQNNITLINGYRYKFEFDAYSTANRGLDGKLETNGDPYTNYGKINPVLLKSTLNHYEFEFVMEDQTDYFARVVFNCGVYPEEIFIDNVSLKQVSPNGLDLIPDEIPNEYSLSQNYPNPFNPSTRINYSLPSQSFVSLKVFDLLGRQIKTLVNSMQVIGNYSVVFNASELPSGIYFYRIEAGQFSQTKKLLLIK